MAVMAYLHGNENGDLTGAKIVTWGEWKDPITKEPMEGVMDPCATGQGQGNIEFWGCGQFCRKSYKNPRWPLNC